MTGSRTKLLAIAIDAAEGTLVDRMIAAGELPAISELASQGSRREVRSPARIGSPWVWPTWVTGADPIEHGIQMGWHWSAPLMAMTRPHTPSDVEPWWRDVAEGGTSVLTLDVPFAPLVDGPASVDVAEWGAHDRIHGRLLTSPTGLAEEITDRFGRHPYSRDVPPPERASMGYLRGAAERAMRGAEQRARLAEDLLTRNCPDLSLITFTEIHRSSHLLWQTVTPDDPLVAGVPRNGLGTPVVDLLRQIDGHVGRLVEVAGDDAAIAVYALHGMRSARGVPAFLQPVLEHFGYATPARNLGGSGLRRAFSAIKHNSPNTVRKAWRTFAPPAMAERVARPTLLLPLDWERTQAFALPTDQHGWVRINLVGREGRGTVAPADYGPVCDELSARLLDLKTTEGRPLVRRIRNLPGEFGAPPHPTLPDLVIEWEDAAHDDPVRVAGTRVAARPEGLKLTGKHTYDGWMVSRGLDVGETALEARDFGNLFSAAVHTRRSPV